MHYKKYIGNKGGRWERVGKRQFDFMTGRGLKPHHKFLDIGCGALRGGRFFINYLDKGNYYGFDHHEWLIRAGVENEIKNEGKEPNFLVNDEFNFSPFGVDFDFVLASSLFSHLTKDKIKQCINNLLSVTLPHVVFYASIFEGDSNKNPVKSHDNKKFRYSIDEIKQLSEDWTIELLRGERYFKQVILEFTRA